MNPTQNERAVDVTIRSTENFEFLEPSSSSSVLDQPVTKNEIRLSRGKFNLDTTVSMVGGTPFGHKNLRHANMQHYRAVDKQQFSQFLKLKSSKIIRGKFMQSTNFQYCKCCYQWEQSFTKEVFSA